MNVPHAFWPMAPPSLEDLPSSVLRCIAALLDLRSLRVLQGTSSSMRGALLLRDLLLEAACEPATWLRQAARGGDVGAVAAICEARADVARADWVEALRLAGERGHREIVSIARHAPGVSWRDRVDALWYAARCGHREAVVELAFADGVMATHRQGAFYMAECCRQHELIHHLWLSNWGRADFSELQIPDSVNNCC